MIERGTGAGWLSGAAEARRDRGAPSVPVAMPDLHDFEAVAAWRHAINTHWGEDDDPDVAHAPCVVGGVPCLRAGSVDSPTVVYVHGGGYCLGSARVAIPITARLARPRHRGEGRPGSAVLQVVSVDYRLAPEHPHPAAVDDVAAVCAALDSEGVSYGLAGDSAGAGIALAVAMRLRDAGASGPAAIAMFSPHLDHAGQRRRGPEATELAALSLAYLGDTDAEDPGVSPLRGDLEGLAPTLIQSALDEAPVGQAVTLSRRLRIAGVPCDLDLWAGMWHTWHYHRDLPEADLALAEAAAFLASAISARSGGA
jgi:monoterpene epsilon-lactone hydrolase